MIEEIFGLQTRLLAIKVLASACERKDVWPQVNRKIFPVFLAALESVKEVEGTFWQALNVQNALKVIKATENIRTESHSS